MAYPSHTVARKLLDFGNECRRPLTPLEIMKLTYICHGWHLALRNEALVSDQAQAWQYGPVFPDLYQSLKSYGASPVTQVPVSSSEWFEKKEMGDAEVKVTKNVFEAYRRFNGIQLSSMTHQAGTPWDQAWRRGKNSSISDESIKAHFLDLARQRLPA